MTALFVICVLIAMVSLAFLLKDTLLGRKDKVIVLSIAVVALILGIVFIVAAIRGATPDGEEKALELSADLKEVSTAAE